MTPTGWLLIVLILVVCISVAAYFERKVEAQYDAEILAQRVKHLEELNALLIKENEERCFSFKQVIKVQDDLIDCQR